MNAKMSVPGVRGRQCSRGREQRRGNNRVIERKKKTTAGTVIDAAINVRWRWFFFFSTIKRPQQNVLKAGMYEYLGDFDLK